MKTSVLPAALGLLGLAACASGPSPQVIHAECRLEMDAARTAVQLRNTGKDKPAMLHTLPSLHPDSTRLLHQMYQIVDETYTCPDLNDIVYGIYRYEYCARQLRREVVPAKLEDVHRQLQSCQAVYARQVSAQAIACVRAVFATTPDKMTAKN